MIIAYMFPRTNTKKINQKPVYKCKNNVDITINAQGFHSDFVDTILYRLVYVTDKN